MNMFTKRQIIFFILSFMCSVILIDPALSAKEARELDWGDLAPEGYFESLEEKQKSTLGGLFDNFGDAFGFDDNIDDDSEEAQKAYDELQVSLRSAPIVPELNGEFVKLAGFVVPLEFDFENGTFTEFLLAPYFGACIHVPPPPSNQMVHVKSPKPIEQKWLDYAIWVTGTMTTDSVDSEYGYAGYSMKDVQLEIYDSE